MRFDIDIEAAITRYSLKAASLPARGKLLATRPSPAEAYFVYAFRLQPSISHFQEA